MTSAAPGHRGSARFREAVAAHPLDLADSHRRAPEMDAARLPWGVVPEVTCETDRRRCRAAANDPAYGTTFTVLAGVDLGEQIEETAKEGTPWRRVAGACVGSVRTLVEAGKRGVRTELCAVCTIHS